MDIKDLKKSYLERKIVKKIKDRFNDLKPIEYNCQSASEIDTL